MVGTLAGEVSMLNDNVLYHAQRNRSAWMADCTGPCMCQPVLRRPFNVENAKSAIGAPC